MSLFSLFGFLVFLVRVYKSLNDTSTGVKKERVRKPVRFISNDKQLPADTNLTIHYSHLLQVPKSLPSFTTGVIDVCYRYPDTSESQKHAEDKDMEAARNFLFDRINFTSYLN